MPKGLVHMRNERVYERKVSRTRIPNQGGVLEDQLQGSDIQARVRTVIKGGTSVESAY